MFLQPGALLVLAGVGTLIHYNDERRAISKGLLYFLVFFVVFGNIMYAFQKMLILCITPEKCNAYVYTTLGISQASL